MPCAAASSSMRDDVRRVVDHRLQPARREGRHATWSSWLAEVGRLSTLAGCASDLFSDASAAAVTCAIMKPELRPGSGARNGGRPRDAGVDQHRDAALGDRADLGDARGPARRRRARPARRGSCRRTASRRCRAKTSGLSVTALASRTQHLRGVAQLVEAGAHRPAAGSAGCRGPARGRRLRGASARIALPAQQRAVGSARTSICPGWPRSAWMRGSNGPSLPRAASTVSAPVTSAASNTRLDREQRVQRQRGRDLRAVDQREALLGRERERRDAGRRQRRGGRHARSPSREHLAVADQRQRQVRERREVARRADRALATGSTARGRRCAARASASTTSSRTPEWPRARLAALSAGQPHDGAGSGAPTPTRVRADQVELQQREVAVRDARVGELAEAGVDAVDRRVALGRALRRAPHWRGSRRGRPAMQRGVHRLRLHSAPQRRPAPSCPADEDSGCRSSGIRARCASTRARCIGRLRPCSRAHVDARPRSRHRRGASRRCAGSFHSTRSMRCAAASRAVADDHHAGVLRVAHADAAAVVERHPGRAAGGVEQRVEQRPVGDRVASRRASLRSRGWGWRPSRSRGGRGRSRSAPSARRCATISLKARPSAVAVAQADPADARRQALERDALARPCRASGAGACRREAAPSPSRRSCRCPPDRPRARPSGTGPMPRQNSGRM